MFGLFLMMVAQPAGSLPSGEDPASVLLRFPSAAETYARVQDAASHIERLKVLAACYPSEPKWRAMLAEAQQAGEVWHFLAAAHSSDQVHKGDPPMKAYYLRRVQERLSDEAYYFGWMPDPTNPSRIYAKPPYPWGMKQP